MKYKELLKRLSELPEEQLAMNVTVCVLNEEEFYPADFTFSTEKSECGGDVLDEGHPIIVIE